MDAPDHLLAPIFTHPPTLTPPIRCRDINLLDYVLTFAFVAVATVSLYIQLRQQESLMFTSFLQTFHPSMATAHVASANLLV